MRHIFLSILLLWLNYRKQTWRLMPLFFRPLLYIVFINSSYYYFFKKHILWELQSNTLKLKQLRIVHIFCITPLIFLLCMANFPKENVLLQIKHILKWSLLCSCFECIGLKLKMIYFRNGWSLFWSWTMYLFLFGYGYLYSIKPVSVWKITLPTLGFFLIKFKAPIKKVSIHGPLHSVLRS